MCCSIISVRFYLVFVHFSLQFNRHGSRLLQLPKSVLPRKQKLLKHICLIPVKQQKHTCQLTFEQKVVTKHFLGRDPINSRPKHNPLPECDPVLLGLFCEALLPLLIQTPHLAVLLHVSFYLFCQREIWSF